MRIGLKYITPMLAAGATAVAIGAAPIAAAASAPAQPETVAAALPWRRRVGTGAVGTEVIGTAAVGIPGTAGAVVGGLGSIPGAGAGKRPITR